MTTTRATYGQPAPPALLPIPRRSASAAYPLTEQRPDPDAGSGSGWLGPSSLSVLRRSRQRYLEAMVRRLAALPGSARLDEYLEVAGNWADAQGSTSPELDRAFRRRTGEYFTRRAAWRRAAIVEARSLADSPSWFLHAGELSELLAQATTSWTHRADCADLQALRAIRESHRARLLAHLSDLVRQAVTDADAAPLRLRNQHDVQVLLGRLEAAAGIAELMERADPGTGPCEAMLVHRARSRLELLWARETSRREQIPLLERLADASFSTNWQDARDVIDEVLHEWGQRDPDLAAPDGQVALRDSLIRLHLSRRARAIRELVALTEGIAEATEQLGPSDTAWPHVRAEMARARAEMQVLQAIGAEPRDDLTRIQVALTRFDGTSRTAQARAELERIAAEAVRITEACRLSEIVPLHRRAAQLQRTYEQVDGGRKLCPDLHHQLGQVVSRLGLLEKASALPAQSPRSAATGILSTWRHTFPHDRRWDDLLEAILEGTERHRRAFLATLENELAGMPANTDARTIVRLVRRWQTANGAGDCTPLLLAFGRLLEARACWRMTVLDRARRYALDPGWQSRAEALHSLLQVSGTELLEDTSDWEILRSIIADHHVRLAGWVTAECHEAHIRLEAAMDPGLDVHEVAHQCEEVVHSLASVEDMMANLSERGGVHGRRLAQCRLALAAVRDDAVRRTALTRLLQVLEELGESPQGPSRWARFEDTCRRWDDAVAARPAPQQLEERLDAYVHAHEGARASWSARLVRRARTIARNAQKRGRPSEWWTKHEEELHTIAHDLRAAGSTSRSGLGDAVSAVTRAHSRFDAAHSMHADIAALRALASRARCADGRSDLRRVVSEYEALDRGRVLDPISRAQIDEWAMASARDRLADLAATAEQIADSSACHGVEQELQGIEDSIRALEDRVDPAAFEVAMGKHAAAVRRFRKRLMREPWWRVSPSIRLVRLTALADHSRRTGRPDPVRATGSDWNPEMYVPKQSLGADAVLGDGGQGIVRLASQFPGLAFKEYRFTDSSRHRQLEALVRLHAGLGNADRDVLDRNTAWPVAIVHETGQPVGFLMVAAGDEYWQPAGPKLRPTLMTGQFLMFPPKATWRHVRLPSSAERRDLVLQVLRVFEMFDRHSIVYGDVSGTNLLWSLSPEPRVLLLDCDGVRPAGQTRRLDTLDWHDPHSAATDVESDRYKVALLVMRILLVNSVWRPDGSQPKGLLGGVGPSAVKAVGDLVRRAGGPPRMRPTAGEWLAALG